jgi:error-prone DNA polymerase
MIIAAALTGIANGILWPDRFERQRQRRAVTSASMIGMKGRVQKEGEIIHVISDQIIDHADLLHRVGEMSFPHRTGRFDGAKHPGSRDRSDKGCSPEPYNSYWPPHATARTRRMSSGSNRTTSADTCRSLHVTSAW